MVHVSQSSPAHGKVGANPGSLATTWQMEFDSWSRRHSIYARLDGQVFVMGILAFIGYIGESYRDGAHYGTQGPRPLPMLIFDSILIGVVLFDCVYFSVAHAQRLLWPRLVAIVVIVPIILAYFSWREPLFNEIVFGFLSLRLLLWFRGIRFITSPLWKQVTLVLLSFLVITLLSASAIIYSEHMAAYTSFYFLIVTVATVGYGDIHPTNVVSQYIIIVTIFAIIIVVPAQATVIGRIVSERHAWDGNFKKRNTLGHVIVMGHITAGRLESLFTEFFHKDQGVFSSFDMVILSPAEPSSEVRRMINHTSNLDRVQYIRGNALSGRDLQRVCIDDAVCVLIYSKFWESRDGNDDKITALRAVSIKRANPRVPMTVQMIANTFTNLVSVYPNTRVIQGEALNVALLARSIACPGLCSLLHGLLTMQSSVPKTYSWLKEYLDGVSYEIYTAPMHESCVGRTYLSVVTDYYRTHRIVIFGIQTHCRAKEDPLLVLNPGRDYVFTGDEQLFMIASDRKVVSKLFPTKSEDCSPVSQNTCSMIRSSFQRQPRPHGAQEKVRQLDAYYGSGHVIITNCGPGLRQLLEMLRNPLCPPMELVALMPETWLSDEVTAIFAEFGVALIVGDPFEWRDWQRAGVESARRVVVTANPHRALDEKQVAEYVDGDAILIFSTLAQNCDLKKLHNRPVLLVELMEPKNIKLFDAKYEPGPCLRTPLFAAGAISINLLDLASAQSFVNPFLPQILSNLLQFQEEFGPLGRSNFDQWPIPPEFAGRRFVEYFTWVLQTHDAICIGLYRNTRPSSHQRLERDTHLPYSYANPPASLPLCADDFAFVIRHETRAAAEAAHA